MVLLQLKDPLELFVKRKEFLPSSGFLSHCNMIRAVESEEKTYHVQQGLSQYFETGGSKLAIKKLFLGVLSFKRDHNILLLQK